MAGPDFREYPATLKQSTLNPEIVYRRSDELIAVRSPRVRSGHEGPVLTVTGDDGESIAVYRGGPEERGAWSANAASVTAAYTQSGTKIVVPTGLVFVRFRDPVSASTKREDIEGAGYRIVKVLPYAPNAAWLEAHDGRITSALANIGRLEALSDVVNVEPQLLAPRMAR
ncbi:MAG TPA: hypothetical protein VIG07_05500 [Methylomirabilota bacterium]|jgi:hypothetical protein